MSGLILVSVAVFPDGSTFWTDAGLGHAKRAIESWQQTHQNYVGLDPGLVHVPMRAEDYTRKVPATVDAARLADG